jgi:hypothetical protein
MPGVTGRELKALAFAKFGTNSWNVAASVTKGAYFTSDGNMRHQPIYVEDRSFGQTFLGPAEQGDVTAPDIALEGQQRFEDNNYVLEACAMGSPAAVAISTSATGQVTSWSHVIDPAPSIDGLGVTLASDRKLYVEELVSGKVYGFGETAGDGGVMMQTFRVLGSQVTNISSVNINSTVYGAAYPALNGRIMRKHGVFRINAQGGGALGASDEIKVASALEFNFARPQSADFCYGSAYIIEPGDNDFPALDFRVTFARMNTITANSLRVGLQNGAVYKCDWTYSGTFINSTDRYTKKWQFPYAELQDFQAPPAGAAQVRPVAFFRAKLPSSAPTGMTGVTMPFRLTRIMVNSVHAFA